MLNNVSRQFASVRYWQFIIFAFVACLLGLPPQIAYADGSISYGQTVSGTVQDDEGERWYFEGRKDDVIKVTLRRDDSCHSMKVRLYDPTGREVRNYTYIYNSRSRCRRGVRTSEMDNIRLAVSGQYYIRPYLYSGSAVSYSLTLKLRGGRQPSDDQQRQAQHVTAVQGTLTEHGYLVDMPYGLETIAIRKLNPNSCPELGTPAACAMNLLDAVSIDGYIEQGVQFCFPQRGAIFFLPSQTEQGAPIDQTHAQPIPLRYFHSGNKSCVKPVPRAGKLLLAAGGHPPSSSGSAAQRRCSLEPQLRPGDWARQNVNRDVNMRREPSTSSQPASPQA